jgi:pyruvate ferredoxin oxidoreductase gamma subunit
MTVALDPDKMPPVTDTPAPDTGQNLTEIRWHARGGQGAVTAAKMVAELALGQGKYFQAFPEYGPERSGAPIVAFTRVSDEPIQIYSGIEHPQIVIVLDASLLGAVNVLKGAPDDAVVLINSEMAPAELRAHYGLAGGRLYTIAATRIALETIKRPIPNTPMVGALTRITGLFPIEKVVEFLRYEFGKKFPPKVVEGNITAITRSYEEVRGE